MLALPKLSTRQIDVLNIGLMVVALILAYILPFELFLFSYAVLGPLHYLTEISWLHKKNYYVPGWKKSRLWVFPLIASVLTLMLIFNTWSEELFHVKTSASFQRWSTNIIFFLFAVSGILVILQKHWQRWVALGVLGIVALSLNLNSTCVTCTDVNGKPQTLCNTDSRDARQFVQKYGRDLNNDQMISVNGSDNCSSRQEYRTMALLFGAYIPSLIHVYIFTMLFMLFGALKSSSKTGYLSVVVLIACGILPFVWDPPFLHYTLTGAVRKVYDVTFLPLNQTFFDTFRMGPGDPNTIYGSNVGVMLTRFIAFAYTYHYLNWFSKTSIIQWHKVPVANLVVVLVLWLISVGLYAMDYKTGFTALLFLSFLHVFVEFPLNFQSFIGIGKAALGKLKPA